MMKKDELVSTIEDVATKQRSFNEKTRTTLEELRNSIQRTLLQQREASNTDPLKALVSELKKKKPGKVVKQATLDYHAAIKKYESILDKRFNLNVCEAARHERLNPLALKKVILNHLYREGLFEVGDQLKEEAKLPADAGMEARAAFGEMHYHLALIQEGNLAEPLAWAVKHRSRLSRSGTPTALEFKMQRIMFLDTLHSQGVEAALQHAQLHLEPFQADFMPQIKQLMGRLLYAGRPLDKTPYGHLQKPPLLKEVAADFNKATCHILGQASQSELLLVTAAGALALPQLCKLAKVSKVSMQGTDFRALSGDEQMPIEIELSPEFYFHSIFACPVSKEQALKDNPPKMLPCGHVLASNTIDNLAGMRQTTFKCPYCPEETTKDMCRTLIFPDIE